MQQKKFEYDADAITFSMCVRNYLRMERKIEELYDKTYRIDKSNGSINDAIKYYRKEKAFLIARMKDLLHSTIEVED